MNRGCAFALLSAAITGFMLFINGSIVWAVLSVLAAQGLPWVTNSEFSQFLLFALPVFMCLLEWKLIDAVRRYLS